MLNNLEDRNRANATLNQVSLVQKLDGVKERYMPEFKRILQKDNIHYQIFTFHAG